MWVGVLELHALVHYTVKAMATKPKWHIKPSSCLKLAEHATYICR